MSTPSGGGSGNYNANVVLSADVSQYQQSMGSAVQTTNEANSSLGKLSQTLGDVKNAAKDKLVNFDRGIIATLAAGTASAALFQKQLSTLNATAANNGQSMKVFKAGIESAFKSLPVARTELTALATQISQMGVVSAREVGSMVTTFEKLAAATGGSANSLAASMLQFTNAMGDQSSGNVKAMSNSLVDLAAKEGLAAQNIADFAQAIAPLARVSGITENQVLGLSAAFSKAGADGYVAANTFNSMLENITQLSSTGSPELAKYANVLGMTVSQFNKLPRSTAIADLFQTINSQGQQGISTLNNLGINGVRAISSLQSVVSQGDLGSLIQGGSTTNGALDKGASAAFNNLSDSLVTTRNEMTQYGTYIGTTFLSPLNAAVKVVNSLVNALGGLAPLLAVPAAALGVLGSGLGGVMSIAAPLVAMRWLRRSPIGVGFRGGLGAGRRLGAGAEEVRAYEDRMGPMMYSNARMDTEAARMTQRLQRQGLSEPEIRSRLNEAGLYRGELGRASFGLGSFFGRGSQTAVPVGQEPAAFFRGAMNRVITSPLAGIRYVAQAQTNYLRNTYGQEPFQTPITDRFLGLGRHAFGTASRAFYSAGGGAEGEGAAPVVQQARSLREKMNAGIVSSTDAFARLNTRIMADAEAIQKRITEEGRNTETSKALAQQTGAATRALAELSGASIRASTSALGATARGIPGSAIVGGIGRFGAGLAKDLFSSPLMAVMTGAFVGKMAYDKIKDQSTEQGAVLDKYTNPIQKYNEQLGIASTNLAEFGKNLSGNNKAIQENTVTNYRQAAKVTGTDVATKSGTVTNEVFTALKSMGLQGGELAKAGASAIGTMPITDPKQLQAIKQDMLSAGFSMTETQSMLAQYMQQGRDPATGLMKRLNYAAIGRQVLPTEGAGVNLTFSGILSHFHNPIAPSESLAPPGSSQSEAGAAIIASAVSGIQSGYQANVQYKGPGYASLLKLKNTAQLFSGMLGAAEGTDHASLATREAIARGLSKMTGGGTADYLDALRSQKGELGITQAAVAQQKGRRSNVLSGQAIINLLGQAAEGRQFLADVSATTGKDATDPGFFYKIKQYMVQVQNSVGGDFNQRLIRSGGLGTLAARDQNIQQAIGIGQSDPRKVNKAVETLATQAYENAGAMAGNGRAMVNATTKLQRLADMTGDLQGPFSQLALAAKDMVSQFLSYQMPTYTRAQQAGIAQTGMEAALAAKPGSEDYAKNKRTAMDAFQASKESNRQYLIGIYQQLQGYQNQMGDAWKDYHTSVERSNKAFYLQEQYAQQDYNTSVLRQTKAFNLQQLYAQQDFQKSMFRARRDYRIQQQQQAEQTAQTIYDPFSRIQPVQTMSSTNLVLTLKDQNAAIRRQKNELDALVGAGLSKEAIRELNLADPSNAQQVDRLFVEAQAGETGWIAVVNASSAKRIKVSKSLTQNDYNLQFQQGNQNFIRGLKDARKDYETAEERARAAQAQTLAYMAKDYEKAKKRAQDAQAQTLEYMSKDFRKMIHRSQRDLRIAMTEISGDFGDMWKKVMNQLHGKLGNLLPNLVRQLKGIQRLAPGFFQTYFGTPFYEGMDPGSSMGEHSGSRIGQLQGAHTFRWPNPVDVDPNAPGHRGHRARATRRQIRRLLKDINNEYPGTTLTPGGVVTLGQPSGYATGGIGLNPEYAKVNEYGPEAHIPLDATGQRFMVGMYNAVGAAVAQKMRTAGHSSPGMGNVYNVVKTDNSANFSGPITVKAEDTRQMLADLQRINRLNRLSSAGRTNGTKN